MTENPLNKMSMQKHILIITIGMMILNVGINAQNPFEKFGYEVKVLTMSNGKFNEFFDLDTIQQIGEVLINTNTMKVIGFAKQDTINPMPEPYLISRWISTDPLAEEYYSISPYAYVANNPLKYIDPNGMLIDDYYLKDGTFVGSDGKGDNIKILSGEAEEKAKKKMKSGGNNTEEDYEYYSENSRLFSETALTGSAVLNIIGNYYDGDINDIFPSSQSESVMAAGFASAATFNKETGDMTSKGKPKLFVFRSKYGHVESLLDNINNVKSLLSHENHHITKDITFENGIYTKKTTDINYGDHAIIRHLFGAYTTQYKDPSFGKTTPALRKAFDAAINNYTMAIKSAPLRNAVINYFKKNLNYKFK